MEFIGSELTLPELPESTRALRQRVREFIADELAAGRFEPRCNSWLEGYAPEFSRWLGERGWIGHHWPREYGGRGGSAFDTLTINEELLAAGAPVAAHWIAARQSGPLLMRFGTEAQRREFLPRIAAGELFFSIGMSEPDVGSDLASVRTRARKVDGGWTIDGRKIWTSFAHQAHYLIALCRTSAREEGDRHEGLSQLIVDLRTPGVSIRPIRTLDGAHHFNEVVFDAVAVPDERVVGEIGDGWRQVTSELAYERSGPERFLSTFPLIECFVRHAARDPNPTTGAVVGRLLARLMTLRGMNLGVWSALAAGGAPALEAALVKDLGTIFEGDSIEAIRRAMADAPVIDADIERLLAQATLAAPTFTLRGGTTEILRGIISKGLARA